MWLRLNHLHNYVFRSHRGTPHGSDGLGFTGFRVYGAGFRVQGLGFKVHGLGFRV